MQQDATQDPSSSAPTPAPGDAAALLQALACPVLQLDAAGCVQWASGAALQLLGDVQGQAFAALWTHPAAATALCADAAAQALLYRADHRCFQAHSQPLPAGGWALTLLLQVESANLTALAAPATELQSQLALAVNLGGIAIWRHDLTSGRIHTNPQGWHALGQPPRPEGMDLEELRDLIHPDDRARVVASAVEALQSTQPVDVEARYRHGDGSWHDQLVRRMVLRDAAGRPMAVLGVALDITERRQEGRRAKDMQRRFETVTRAAGIGYWMLEPDQGVSTWSDRLLAMHGLAAGAPAPSTRQWLTDFVHPDDAAHVRESTYRWMHSSEQSLELSYRVRRVDGDVRQLLSHSQREAGVHGPLLFGVVIDLTERLRVEQALKSAQDRVALAARAAGLGTWEVDLATGALHWDEQMWHLRGVTPQPVMMSREERLACVHPEDRTRAESQTRDALASGGVFEMEFRVQWPDGSTHWLASRSIEISDPDPSGGGGLRQRRIGVNWDVTDIRTADSVRQEREIALRESASKSKFLARMSHELRTPLNAVLGFAQLLLAEEAGVDAAAASRRRRLEHIRSAGQHLLTLINDVLSLSALEGGEVRIALQPVALQPLVAQTLPMLAPLQQQYALRIEQGPLDLHVMSDATRLRQALINLLSNALKYNRPGGSVRVEALRRGASVLLRVTDTGRGMSDDQLRHLFEPFNRLGADRGEIEGTGIGLAITKALVERMGGSVHVDSRQGEGSVFELRLPAAEPPTNEPMTAPMTAQMTAPMTAPSTAPASPPEAATAPAAAVFPRRPAALRGQHRVLYIEDNPVNALIVSELAARRSDIALHIAVDGARGVQQAQALLPDLILLDLQLPDFDGFEVLRRLQASPQTARIPCIALSANAMPADIERTLKAGVADYWTKPLDFRAFMDSLDRLFGKTP